ncbi:hypothetical protein CROQUDRAFT_87176 [Cronartium quercuum f. sp. fusiforme G11]|uniref:Uncharacterized protein n=1 Tax=Cronartium quercuum f. sp. fusiforme G11 TaxID=708437 RepID=A0A9P6TG41_9BASI|nr:hypothetical protein CROQUDRAFT_87176 [Cronartium quercuum f. sp. fusiforme G11]
MLIDFTQSEFESLVLVLVLALFVLLSSCLFTTIVLHHPTLKTKEHEQQQQQHFRSKPPRSSFVHYQTSLSAANSYRPLPIQLVQSSPQSHNTPHTQNLPLQLFGRYARLVSRQNCLYLSGHPGCLLNLHPSASFCVPSTSIYLLLLAFLDHNTTLN